MLSLHHTHIQMRTQRFRKLTDCHCHLVSEWQNQSKVLLLHDWKVMNGLGGREYVVKDSQPEVGCWAYGTGLITKSD